VGDHFPAPLVLLPHGHRAQRLLRKRLPVERTAQNDAVGDHKRVAVHLAGEVPERVLLDLKLKEFLERCFAFLSPAGRQINEVRGDVLVEIFPVLFLNVIPESAF